MTNKLLRVYTAADLIDVCDTENFIITEQIFQDVHTAEPKWSTIYITLKGKKQTPSFANKHADMRYDLTNGECWFLLGTAGEPVKAPCKILVPRETPHFLLNVSDNPLKYTIDVSGYLDMRNFFGLPMKEVRQRQQNRPQTPSVPA